MATNDENFTAPNLETTPRAFATRELVPCPVCSRSNPPTRPTCLYCGGGLGISVLPVTSAEPVASGLPEPETENAFHIVLPPPAGDRCEATAKVAQHVSLSPDELKSLLKGRVAPLFSARASADAAMICDRLRAMGVEVTTVSDEQLHLETPSKEVAALTLTDTSLTALVRRTGERISTAWEDITLIVPGRLYFTTNEVEQKGGKANQVLEERQMTFDEAVIDIYARGDNCGWRLRANGFDFSCLGQAKKATAFENFNALHEVLKRSAVNAVCDDGYLRVRAVLNKIWPPELRATTTERRRTFKHKFNATATTTDNELQFTRYSRLLRFFDSVSPDNAGQS